MNMPVVVYRMQVNSLVHSNVSCIDLVEVAGLNISNRLLCIARGLAHPQDK